MKKIILLLVPLLILSCKKNQLGGTSTIKGTVLHHERFIANATVYIKFNSKDFPGTDVSKYDANVAADASGNYSLKCYKGDYYLYGVGYDPEIKEPVTGGIPIHIRNHETVNTDVPVTE